MPNMLGIKNAAYLTQIIKNKNLPFVKTKPGMY